MTTIGSKVAARLRQLRLGKGWTLREASLATQGILSPSRISNYEQGIREVGTSEAEILARLYSTTAAHILCLDEDSPVLTRVEAETVRNLRAMPEGERNGYIRRIAALAEAYKDRLPDEKLTPKNVRKRRKS